MRRRLLIAIQSILVGWAVLFALGYIVERPLLIWTAHLVGAQWVATAKLSLDCLTLATTGWVVGRCARSAPLFGVLAFAATLGFCSFDPLLDTNLSWLIRLGWGALRDTRYLSLLAAPAVSYLFLFGSLFGGALLSRPLKAPFSLFDERPRSEK